MLLEPDCEASIADLARQAGSDPGNLTPRSNALCSPASSPIAGQCQLTSPVAARRRQCTDRPAREPAPARLRTEPALERALTDVPSIKQAFISGSWAARYQGRAGVFPHDVDVIVVGTPNRDDVTDAVIEALHAVGHNGQVVFRSAGAWRDVRDAFTRTAKAAPIVHLTVEGAC